MAEQSESVVRPMNTVNWVEQLKNARESGSDGLDAQPLLPSFKKLLEKYNNVLKESESYSKEEKKSIILNVRSALRLALSWTSITDADSRDKILGEAVVALEWHKFIFDLLASKKGDSKCRTLAAQLLSNLVTSNPQTAQVVSSSIPLSPSEESVTNSLRCRLEQNGQHENLRVSGDNINWLDIILINAQAGNREALAAMVAALHNTVVALQKDEGDASKKACDFAHHLANDRLLVNTLLRHIISAKSITKPCKMESQTQEDTYDSATEWISLLLIKCCKLGFMPDLMLSLCGRDAHLLDAFEPTIVPEQVVLLQCIQSEVEQLGEREDSILGGERGLKDMVATHLFLAKFYSSLRIKLGLDSQELIECKDNADDSLLFSASVSTIDVLACSLGQDRPCISSVRRKVGSSRSTIIRDICVDLGKVLDSVSRRNSGRKNRDFIVHDTEKRFMTSLVRLIGNICFRCPENQNLVRLTSVPPHIEMTSDSRVAARNGLHVVLSCTSLSHACFTLREWAIIAIRNLLDNNELNQAQVADLEANEPVQSAELASLGIRVDLDPRGNVSVHPTLEKQNPSPS